MTDKLRQFRSARVAVLGGASWSDPNPVRLAVKMLGPGTTVLVDDEVFVTTAAAVRQCRCSNLVAVQVRQPGLGRDAIEARRARDATIFSLADRVLFFGEVPPDRAKTLEQFEAAGLEVERLGAAAPSEAPIDEDDEP